MHTVITKKIYIYFAKLLIVPFFHLRIFLIVFISYKN
jgi:hypothetical protein